MAVSMENAAASGQFEVKIGDFSLQLALAVDPGRILVLFGPSGAGKSTALRTMAGLVRPEAGWITIAGHTVYSDGSGLGGQSIWVPPHRRSVGTLRRKTMYFPTLRSAKISAMG